MEEERKFHRADTDQKTDLWLAWLDANVAVKVPLDSLLGGSLPHPAPDLGIGSLHNILGLW